jgi:hypothetical protein
MQRHRAKKEMEQLERVVEWLDAWQERRRDPADSQQLPRPAGHPVFQAGVGSA